MSLSQFMHVRLLRVL